MGVVSCNLYEKTMHCGHCRQCCHCGHVTSTITFDASMSIPADLKYLHRAYRLSIEYIAIDRIFSIRSQMKIIDSKKI